MCCLDAQVIREANCLTDHCMVKAKAIEKWVQKHKEDTYTADQFTTPRSMIAIKNSSTY